MSNRFRLNKRKGEKICKNTYLTVWMVLIRINYIKYLIIYGLTKGLEIMELANQMEEEFGLDDAPVVDADVIDISTTESVEE